MGGGDGYTDKGIVEPFSCFYHGTFITAAQCPGSVLRGKKQETVSSFSENPTQSEGS